MERSGPSVQLDDRFVWECKKNPGLIQAGMQKSIDRTVERDYLCDCFAPASAGVTSAATALP